jgi:hypothetical protein
VAVSAAVLLNKASGAAIVLNPIERGHVMDSSFPTDDHIRKADAVFLVDHELQWKRLSFSLPLARRVGFGPHRSVEIPVDSQNREQVEEWDKRVKQLREVQ